MKKFNYERAISRKPCRTVLQVGDSYCAVGAFAAEYLGRDNLDIQDLDGMIVLPPDLAEMMEVMEDNNVHLRDYTLINDDRTKPISETFKTALDALVKDAAAAGLIELESQVETVSQKEYAIV